MLVYSLIYMNEPFICNTLNMVHTKALSIYQYESNSDEMTCIYVPKSSAPSLICVIVAVVTKGVLA